VIDSFYSVLATVIFLTANGHHAVLSALDETFRFAPVGLLSTTFDVLVLVGFSPWLMNRRVELC